MAWLLAIMFVPFLGFVFFILIGTNRLPRARRHKLREVTGIIERNAQQIENQIPIGELDPDVRTIVRANEGLGALPMSSTNTARIETHYAESLAAMTARIDEARHTVNAEFYILTLDDTTQAFFDALVRAQQRGVAVRVLLDFWASRRRANSHKTTQFLTQHGIAWHYMLPVQPLRGQFQRPDLRNHRKLLIIDHRIGFLGSQNVIASHYHKHFLTLRDVHWVDSMVEVHGPAVLAINAVFTADWFVEAGELVNPAIEPGELPSSGDRQFGDEISCQIVSSGPGFGNENNLRLFLDIVYGARHSLQITSPYFVPTEAMLLAMSSAVLRGVNVELFVSEISDQILVHNAQRSYYEALLNAGVTIWQYRSPAILHSKFFVADDRLSVFGSANMDPRSFQLNAEVTMFATGQGYIAQLQEIIRAYRASSTLLTMEEWQQRSPIRRGIENLCRLTSSLQ